MHCGNVATMRFEIGQFSLNVNKDIIAWSFVVRTAFICMCPIEPSVKKNVEKGYFNQT